jgi:hypothetical protein
MNRLIKTQPKSLGYLLGIGLLCAALIGCQSTEQTPLDENTGLVPSSSKTSQHPLPSVNNQPPPQVEVGTVDGIQAGSKVVVEAFHTTRVSTRFAPGAAPKVKLKLLVVAATSDETTFEAITAFLKQIGTPFDTLIASTTDLTEAFLETEAGLGNYNGILLTTANLAWNNPITGFESAFTPAEWITLRTYEAQYKAREVDLYSFPDGVDASYPGNTGMVFTGAVDTTSAPLNAQLTTKGQQIFPFLQPSINIPIRYAYTYTASVVGTAVPVMTTASGVVAALNATTDGREVLALTMAHNPYLTHSVLMSYGLIRWVSRGVFLGEKQMYFSAHVDDVFIPNDVWDTATNANSTTVEFRLRPNDLVNTVNWQSKFRVAHNKFSSFKLDFLFNGLPFNTDLPGGGFDTTAPNTCGRVPAGKDPFTSKAKCYKSNFRWMNHTKTHIYIDSPATLPVPPATQQADLTLIGSEIGFNINIAKSATGLNLIGNEFDSSSLVIGNHSGLGYMDEAVPPRNYGKSHSNPALILAAQQFGIQFLGANTSAPITAPVCASDWIDPVTGLPNPAKDCNQNNPSPNTGVWLNAATLPVNNIMLVPRFPVNIFYNTGTPTLLVSEYNHLYRTFWGRDFTIDEIMEQEANTAIDHILTGSFNPHYFHQTNLQFYTPSPTSLLTTSLLTTFIDKVAQKYEAWMNLPIKNLSMTDLGLKMKARLAYDNAAASAVWDRAAGTVTISGASNINIPLTNPAFGTAYGSDFVRSTQAGNVVTVGQGI